MPQQGCVSVSFPAQSVPPCWAATFVLFLSWVPLPQFTEQVSHVPHVCQVQSTMDPKKHCSTPSYICMIEIRIYLGKRYHCRIVFLYHFLHNQRHHVEQQPLSCSSPECHRHSLPSIFPMCSIHPKYNPLWTPKILQHTCSSLHDWNLNLPGQGKSLQGCVPFSFPTQSAPPCWAAALVLFLSWVPPPQLTEQVSHAPHVCQVQSTMDTKKTLQYALLHL